MTKSPKIAVKDNGYFEIWERPCGHQVRVDTEYTQWARRYRKGEVARLHALDRDRLATTPCRKCQVSGMTTTQHFGLIPTTRRDEATTKLLAAAAKFLSDTETSEQAK